MSKVLVLCLSPSFGGLEMHVRDWARWIARHHTGRLALALAADTPLARELAACDAPRWLAPRARPGASLGIAFALRAFCRAQDVSVLHAHDQHDVTLAALVRAMASDRLLFVLTRHMALGGSKKDPYHALVYRQVERYIAVSAWVAAQARERLPLARERVMHIHPGVPVPPPVVREPAAGELRAGMVGRILPDKGQHLLVEAAAALRARRVPARVLLAGDIQDAAYFDALRAQAQRAGVPLEHLGFVSPPARAFALFDVAVVASRAEAFGLATVDALRAGVPVVAAATGAGPELVRDGVDGLLFAPDDAVALAAALERLWQDPALGARLAQAGAQRAARDFDADTQFARVWEALAL